MIVFVYIDTSKQVGDPSTSRCLPIETVRQPGLRRMIPKASPSSMRSSNERGRQLRRPLKIYSKASDQRQPQDCLPLKVLWQS
jgi:hypothetical protein